MYFYFEVNFRSLYFYEIAMSEGRSAKWKQRGGVPFNNHNLCMGDIFPQEAREEQIINEKHFMLADETSRTRFKTRFQVSGNERCNIQPSVVFFLSPSSFCFRALQSDHLWTTRNQALSLSLSSSLYIGASKKRVTAI